MSNPDLSPFTGFGVAHANLLSVGWLDANTAFAEGDVPKAFFAALTSLLADPWQPAVAAGRHACPFCRFTGGPAELRYGNVSARLGSSNLFVPADRHVFVAPSLIAHYIDSHGYSPPVEFQEAVVQCPPMRSMKYLTMIRKFDLHKIGVSSSGQAE